MGNAELEHKRGGFRGKNARKVGKTIFSYECRKGRVSVDLVPFYADVSFVGVKEGDHFTSLVDLIGDR